MDDLKAVCRPREYTEVEDQLCEVAKLMWYAEVCRDVLKRVQAKRKLRSVDPGLVEAARLRSRYRYAEDAVNAAYDRGWSDAAPRSMLGKAWQWMVELGNELMDNERRVHEWLCAPI